MTTTTTKHFALQVFSGTETFKHGTPAIMKTCRYSHIIYDNDGDNEGDEVNVDVRLL